MSERIYLMTVTGWNPNKSGGAGLDTLYFSTSGFTSQPADTPANTYFEPRISNPGTFSQSMYSEGATGGNSTGGFGLVELLNTDGGLDALVNWGFDGNTCLIQEGPLDGTLADFATVISGTVEQVTHEWHKLTFQFKDRTIELDLPVALNYYAGTNALPAGLEGVADLKGKAKPRLCGSCFNIAPVLVNTSKLTYQYNDGATTSIGAVRDNGVALTLGTSHANSTVMQAATVTAGHYDQCLSEGYIRLGSSPIGQVTMDAVQAATSIGQCFKTLAVEKIGATSIVEQSIIDLDKTIPASMVWGYYTGTDTITTKAVFDELAKAGIWWGFDNNGKFWAKQFSAPSSANPILSLDGTNVLSIEREATSDTDKGVPVWKVTCRYNHNFTPQSTLAGSVAVGAYKEEWLTVSYIDPNDGTATGIRTKHPLATELVIDTPYKNSADALTEATRQFNLRSVRRDRLKVTLPMKVDGPLSYPGCGYWDDEAISDIPLYRSDSTGDVYGNFIYLAGGYTPGSGGTILSSVISLDLTNPTGAWDDSGVTDLPSARSSHASVIHGNYLYILGGLNSGGNLSSVIRLDLTNPTGVWDDSGVTDLPSARSGLKAVVYNNFLYAIAGQGSTMKVIRLDLTNPTGAWDDSGVTDLPISLIGHSVVLFDNYLYTFSSYGSYQRKVFRLDLSNPTSAWDETLNDLPGARRYSGAVVLGNYVFLIGGVDMEYTTVGLTSVIRLDLANVASGWINDTAALPAIRSLFPAIVFNNSIYTFGGDTGAAIAANTWRLRTNENPNDHPNLTSLGRTAIVTMPRYNYNSGRPMKLIGAESNHQDREITLELWG